MTEKCDLCGECKCGCSLDKGKNLKIYLCPKCKSEKVYHPFEFKNLFGLIPKWRCKKCGFESPVFPFANIDKNKLNKRKKRK